ncbi:DUF3426 domain-containing protein [Ectothiorhodospira shaposhnikovii]|uniref:DUF3426 domain-containing protein n=1 Tax=Ectothiorhodospira shaposhnikovii TaxID=1054 RepID=UPI0039A34F5B
MIWALACLTLIALLAGQLAYNEREHLLKHPGAEPWVRQACNWLNCDLPPPADLNAIHLINRQVHTHPTYPGALMVTGRVENRANFPQHWPVMEMVFMDIMGRPIAARRLASDAYLLHPANGLMPPGTPADIRLDLKDPGAAAVSYEFRFLAP